MALTSGKVRVFGTGEIFVAAVGSTAPTDATAAPAAPFVGLGYNSDDGVTFSRDVSVEDIFAWQSVVPVRRVSSETTFTVSATFLESDPTVTSIFLGLGAWEVAGTDFSADGSTLQSVTERAVIVDFLDGAFSYRLYIPRAEVTSDGELSINRTSAAGYPMTFSALAPSAGSVMYTLLTDDPAFDPA